MDTKAVIERIKHQKLTDRERAEIYTIDVLYAKDPEGQQDALARFMQRNPRFIPDE